MTTSPGTDGRFAEACHSETKPTLRKSRYLSIAQLLVLAGGIAASAEAQTVATWTAGNGNWSDSANWNTHPQYPQNGVPTIGSLYDAVLNSAVTVTLTEDITIEHLSSPWNFTLLGAFNLTLNDGLDFSGVNGRLLSGVTLSTTGGTSTITGSGITYLGGGALIQNSSLFDLQGDVDFVYNGGNASTIHNQSGGTFRKSAGTSVSDVGTFIAFSNDGTVQVQSGTLSFTGGGSSSGAFNASSGATVAFSGGTHTLNSGASLTGAGVSLLNGGTLSVASGATVSAQNFQQFGGELSGPGTLQINGTAADWSAGTQSGIGVTRVGSGGTMTFNGANGRILSGRTFDNQGTVNVTTSGTTYLGSGAVIQNSSLFDLQSDADFVFLGGNPTTIHNQSGGTFRKSAGTEVSDIGNTIAFNNDGTVQVQSGTLSFTGGGSSSGEFNASSGATVAFSGGTYTLNPGASLTGAGVSLLNGGTLSVASGATVSAQNFQQSGGELSGPGTLQINGTAADWSAGTQSGTGVTRVGSGGTMTFTGANGRVLSNRAFDNQGTVNVTGSGSTYLGAAALIQNSGLFDLQSSAGFIYNGGNPSTIHNQTGGTFRKSAGIGVSDVGTFIAFNNDGTVQVQSGTLSFTGGGSSSGEFNASSGATVAFSGGTHTLNPGASLTGAGVSLLNGGTLSVASGTTVSAQNFQQSGGDLSGPGTLQINGTAADWSAGTQSGTGVTRVGSGGTMTFTGANGRALSNRTFDNQGTLNVTGSGSTYLGSAALIQNSGLFDLQSNAGFIYNGGNPSTIHNQAGGTFRKSAGIGVSDVGTFIAFNNDGTVQVQSGTLSFTGGGSSSGEFNASSGATVAFSGGTHTLNSGASLTGAGISLLNAGTLSIASGATVSAQNFQQSGGELSGTGTLQLQGASSDWSGGGQLGTGVTRVNSGGTLTFSGAAGRSLGGGRTFDNQGIVNVTGSGITYLSSAALIQNNSLFDLQSDADFSYAGGDAADIHNQSGGTFRKSAGAGVSDVGQNIVFNNEGLITAQSGTLRFASGSYTHNGGTLRVENGAVIELQGGSAQAFASGRFEGNGTFVIPNADVSGATLAPGLSAGHLEFTGNISLGSLATLSVELGGSDRGVTYDAVDVDGSVTAGGFLNITLIQGFIPTPEMTFDIVDAGTEISGAFANVVSGERLSVAGGSGSFLVSYGAGSGATDRVILSQFAPVPEPREWAFLGGSTLALWAATRRLRRSETNPLS